MTEQTLDQVARALATGMPRRRVMKGVLAGGAAGMVALLGARQSQAGNSGCQAQCRENFGAGRNMHECLCGACGIGCPKERI